MIVFSSFLLTAASEYIFRSSLLKTFIWLYSNPVSFLLNLLIISFTILLFTSVFNSYRIAISITTVLVMLFSIINRIKFSLRGIPLSFMDFYLNSEVFTILNVVLTPWIIKIVIFYIIIIPIIILLIFKLPKLNLSILNRFFSFIISIILLFSLIHTNISKFISLNGQNTNYQEYGCILYFVSNINNKSLNLSFEYIMNDMNSLKNNEVDSPNDNNIKPNIIAIMSEAFWDPSKMKGLQFSKNPTPNINQLKSTSIYGYLESPTFGGGTANTEFELLTGNSAHFFNPGYMIYPNEIKAPIMALPSILKNQGYFCKAIHPFKNWYWNRREVYNYMGFDEYLSEEYLINPNYKGFFISDKYVTDLIIKEIEKSDDPLFVFAVTMQNHGPFDDNRYDKYPKDIEISGKASSQSLQIMQTYTQGVYDADKALGKLVDYCSNISKPTLVLFFGDHLPVLGKNYKVYKETGYMSANNPNYGNEIKLTSVPFILWSNYKTKSLDLGLLNTSFMGPYLLEYAELDMPNYFKFLRSFSKEIPVISRSYAIDKKNNIIKSDSEKYKCYNDDYLLVQQNILYKDKVFESNYNNWIIEKNPNYNLNLDKIAIREVILQENKTIIRGNNFYPNCLLFIDNKPYAYKYLNKNEIHIKGKPLKYGSKLQIKLLDSRKTLLTKSNSYTYR